MVAAVTDFDEVVMRTYGRYPIEIVRGAGCELVDAEGKTYLDFVAGIATCTLGHADERLVRAVAEQMGRLTHVSNLYYIPEQGRLARWLVDNSVGERAFFCNSGAEANEAAIKLARKYAAQKGVDNGVIITANNSFHGRTLATITATGQPKYQQGFAPLVEGFVYSPYNDAAALEDTVAGVAKSGRQLVGIMLEACQGEGGVVPGDRGFFQTARRLCDSHDALLIMDEVQVGMGRTGTLWGYEQLGGVEPDVFTTAKGLGGGVPIGAMVCKERVNVFAPGDHASTFGGNPLACAAGLAVGNALLKDGILANVAARGEQLRAGLSKIQNKHPGVVAQVRGWGLINGMVLQEDCGIASGQVVAECMKRGLLVVPAGPTVVRFVPPLVVSEGEVSKALGIVEEAMGALASE